MVRWILAGMFAVVGFAVPIQGQVKLAWKWNTGDTFYVVTVAKTRQTFGDSQKLDQRLDRAGRNLILVRAGGRTVAGTVPDLIPFTLADAEAIRRKVGKFLIGVAPLQSMQKMVSGRTGKWTTLIVGCTPDLQRVRNWKLAVGRFLTDEDIKKQA